MNNLLKVVVINLVISACLFVSIVAFLGYAYFDPNGPEFIGRFLLTPPEQPDIAHPIRFSDSDFSFSYPGNWKLEDGQVVSVSCSSPFQTQTILSSLPEDQEISINDFPNLQKELPNATISNVHEIKQWRGFKGRGVSGTASFDTKIARVFTCRMPVEYTAFIIDFGPAKPRVFACEMRFKATKDRMEPGFVQIFSSLRLIEK